MTNRLAIKAYILQWIGNRTGLQNIPYNQTFRNLGLDSLDLGLLICEVEERFTLHIDAKKGFMVDNIASFIELVCSSEENYSLIAEPFPKSDVYPLTAQQTAIYIASIKNSGSCLYNIPLRLRLPDSVDNIKIKTSLRQLLDNHPELNVKVQSSAGYELVIAPCDNEIVIEQYSDSDAQAFFRPFKLDQGPLMRVATTENYLLFDIHHIIADGRSLYILMRELNALIKSEHVIASSSTYGDYAYAIKKYQASGGFERAKQYFATTLKEGRSVIFPVYAASKEKGGNSAFYHQKVEKEHITTVKEKYCLTNTMFYLSAFCILLKKYTHQTNMLTGITLMNRRGGFMNAVGMFVNTLPIKIPDADNLVQFMAEIREGVLNLYQYQETPLKEALDDSEVMARDINTSFIYQGRGIYSFLIDDHLCHNEWVELNVSKFDMTFEITEEDAGYLLRIEYARDKFSPHTIELMQRSYAKIINQLNTCSRITDIRIFDHDIYKNLYSECCSEPLPETVHAKCIHTIFSEKAKACEDIAIVFQGISLTYEQVDRYSDSLAAILQQEAGIGLGEIVPIIACRSWEMIVAMLAIIKAGGAYLPLDYHCPPKRRNDILEEVGARVILTKGCNISGGKYINYDLSDERLWQGRAAPIPVDDPNALCYVIYTSGTTGIPKGIKIYHKNVINYCSNGPSSIYGRCCGEKIKSILSVTNYAFDIFLTESLFALLYGMTIYMTSDQEANSQEAISNLIEEHQIEMLQTTPTKMGIYIQNKHSLDYLKYLKVIWLGGEKFNPHVYAALRQYTNARIFNVYGPAETTVWITGKEIKDGPITIGTPFENTRIYIFSPEGELCPAGIPGEICIAGGNVGGGYINHPELNRTRFKLNPYNHNETIYLTGDLGYWDENGDLVYSGRMDNQVKVNGMRIELEEIENALTQIPYIDAASVTLKEHQGKHIIVAYYISDREISAATFRETLKEYLMSYMIPHIFMRVKEFPLSGNGKIDRKKLPEVELSSSRTQICNPKNELQRKILEKICQILNCSTISIDDNIIDLGADSLSIVEIVAALGTLGMFIDIQSVIENPSVRAISEIIQQKRERTLFIAEKPGKFTNLLARQRSGGQRRALGNVLITGTTGYLGAHILYELIHSDAKTIYCVVRAHKGDTAENRLRQVFKYYFPHCDINQYFSRVVVVSGDITDKKTTTKLPLSVDTIVHAAANVKHFGDFQEFQRVNVNATEQLLQYAKARQALFVYISTLSVSGDSALQNTGDSAIFFDETCLDNNQIIDNVYVQSKYCAERSVLEAITTGVHAKIVRVGNLTNRYRDFVFQKNYQKNGFLVRLRALITLGYIPDSWLDVGVDFSPVDAVAKAIKCICMYSSNSAIIYHASPHQKITYRDMLSFFKISGVEIQPVEMERFRHELFTRLNGSEEYLLKYFVGIMNHEGNFLIANNISVKNDITTEYLLKTGYTWPKIDERYITQYVNYFKKLGFFP